LKREETALLVSTIKAVLLRSIEQGGTTLKDFLQSDGKPGYFAQELQVYGRAGEPCRVCGTLIESKKPAQRATFFCPRGQREDPVSGADFFHPCLSDLLRQERRDVATVARHFLHQRGGDKRPFFRWHHEHAFQRRQ